MKDKKMFVYLSSTRERLSVRSNSFSIDNNFTFLPVIVLHDLLLFFGGSLHRDNS